MLKDIYGNEIVVGARVAFNQSGSVNRGTVKALKNGYGNQVWDSAQRKYVPAPMIHITPDNEPERTSRVRQPTSVLVLKGSE
jgi:hypothetical protein